MRKKFGIVGDLAIVLVQDKMVRLLLCGGHRQVQVMVMMRQVYDNEVSEMGWRS